MINASYVSRPTLQIPQLFAVSTRGVYAGQTNVQKGLPQGKVFHEETSNKRKLNLLYSHQQNVMTRSPKRRGVINK